MGKPMGRHPITHYINPNEPHAGSTISQISEIPRSQLRMGAPSLTAASKSQKWSNPTNVSSKLGRGPTSIILEEMVTSQFQQHVKGRGYMHVDGNMNFGDGIILLLELLLMFIKRFLLPKQINISTTNALDPSIHPYPCFEDEYFKGGMTCNIPYVYYNVH
jgi:hypothetical protein